MTTREEIRKEFISKIQNERDLLLVPKEVAKYARVTERTIRNWFNSGTLHGFKLGKKLWRVSVVQLKRDFPNLPDEFWWEAALDHYKHLPALAQARDSILHKGDVL